MDGGDHAREEAVAGEGEERPGNREDHAAQVPEHRHRGAHEQERAAPLAQRAAGGIGERRARGRQLGAQHALRDHLQADVEGGRAGKRDEDRARYRAHDVLHFPARRQRALDAGEGEDQERRRAGDVGHRGRVLPREVRRAHCEGPTYEENKQRQQLGHGSHRVER